MTNLNNLLKRTIPVIAFSISQSCSHNKSADELNKYNIKNKNVYTDFRDLIKKKNYLFSKDGKTSAWMDSKKDCAMVKKIIDDKLTITFRDYSIDGLTKNDEYAENYPGYFTSKHLRDLTPKVQMSRASAYAWEVEKLIKENQK